MFHVFPFYRPPTFLFSSSSNSCCVCVPPSGTLSGRSHLTSSLCFLCAGRRGERRLHHSVLHRADVALRGSEPGGEGLVGVGYREPDPGQPAVLREWQKQGTLRSQGTRRHSTYTQLLAAGDYLPVSAPASFQHLKQKVSTALWESPTTQS